MSSCCSLAWDLLPACSGSNQQLLIPSPPGGFLEALSPPLPWLCPASSVLSQPLFSLLHKFIDYNISLDSPLCLLEGRDCIGFILFPSTHLLNFWWMNEYWGKTYSEIYVLVLVLLQQSNYCVTWDKSIAPSDPLFLHLDVKIFRVLSLVLSFHIPPSLLRKFYECLCGKVQRKNGKLTPNPTIQK